MDVESIDYEKTNREKKLTPRKKGKHWCDGCDRNKVGCGESCDVCGALNGHRTIKKETNAA